jgi:hypothetical protein
MNLLAEAMNGLGAVLLQVVGLLLFEELTFGGLVRLLLAPRPGAGRSGRSGEKSLSLECGRKEHNNGKDGGRCLP